MQASNPNREQRANQRQLLFELLKASSPNWVPIREVLEIAGFQYGARIFELRRLGHRVENDPGRAFRLVTNQPPRITVNPSVLPLAPQSLFGDLAVERHRDDG